MTDLLEAVCKCNLWKLKMFINNGWNINYKIPETDGCTILHIIAGTETTSEKKEILSLLLEMGANPNARSYDDLTPVHIAAMWNNCFELEKLLHYGGNPWLLDNENKNSFDLAADNHSYEAYQLLNLYVANDKLNFFNRTNQNSLITKEKLPLLCETIGYEKCTSSDSFHTASENFPLVFSSSDEETISLIINVDKIRKKNKIKEQFSESEEQDICKTINIPLRTNTSHRSILNNDMIYNKEERIESSSCSEQNNNINFETVVSDEVNGIILIEQSNLSVPRDSNSSAKLSVYNDWKSYVSDNTTFSSDCLSGSFQGEELHKEFSSFSDSRIFQELKNLGDNPGPVNKFTRKIYEERLARLKSGCQVLCVLPEQKYCSELCLFLKNKLTVEELDVYGNAMTEEFNNSMIETDWREGTRKNCFNYFLLDPRVTQNLPMRYSTMQFEEIFQIFINAIFYVGKGTKGRPYLHLLDAAKAVTGLHEKTDKINHILDIWSSGHGVISLHCFHNCIPVEAYTKEACIIETLGLKNLTNQKAGHYYGQTIKWTRSWKRKAGISFLNRALQIFLCEGEKQIKAKDLKGN